MNEMINSIKLSGIIALCVAGGFACIYGFGLLCVSIFGQYQLTTTLVTLFGSCLFAGGWYHAFVVLTSLFVPNVD